MIGGNELTTIEPAKESPYRPRELSAKDLRFVAQGRFHIYPVRTIDQGLELLTGIPAAGGPGVEPINDAAARRLKELVVGLKDFVALAHNGAAEMKA